MKNISILFFFIILSSPIYSQIIFSDAFSYSNGNLAGNNGGTGWSGAWSGSNASQVTNSLPGTSGKSIRISNDATVTTRTLSTPITTGSTTYYLSFVFNANPFQDGSGDYAGITLMGDYDPTSDFTPSLFVGMPGSSGKLGFDWARQGDGLYSATNNTNYLVLLKIGYIPATTTTQVKFYATTNLNMSGNDLVNSPELATMDGDGTSNFTIKKVEIAGGYNLSLGEIKIAGLTLANTANDAVSATQTALPLSWTSFTCQKTKDGVELLWSTASEQNTKDFEVQYSTNTNSWQALGTVPAAGNSSTTRNYSYVHQNPLKGNNYNYYRLLQRDIDGKFSYSKIVSVIFNEPGDDLMLYPNPANDILTVFLAEEQQVAIVNAAGLVVWKSKLPAGKSQISINQFSAGVYFLKTTVKTRRFVIK